MSDWQATSIRRPLLIVNGNPMNYREITFESGPLKRQGGLTFMGWHPRSAVTVRCADGVIRRWKDTTSVMGRRARSGRFVFFITGITA